ncbi:isoflavone reductase homolog isoform X1 [Prunus yedoensis var. nudiflora]|uniref:Isoflavone reductase homolog isoform X1 n=1 Tax=Prunus yedoensis var. nudiflora TaxID=2094558 RepID=A0A314YKX0_PRUYE|nr:isoflavone reductase homolog isoform X1 [Prunus yedoensis var. nudiflora]
MGKSKVLVVGGTGYMGRRIVNASLAQGHTTYVLQRPEIGLDIDKLQMLLAFKKQGAHLVEGSFSDFQSLVDAVKLVDVVICTMSGVHFRSHNILLQLKLVEAIKQAGNIKRFFPSEFGLDPALMGHALEPGRVTFDEKMVVRKAIQDAKLPFTYVCGAGFAGYFAGNLSQMGTLVPPREKVLIYGDGNSKVTIVDEDDLATYTIKTIDDPRTLNKTLYFRPPENVLTQKQLVDMWENLTGKKLEHITVSQQDFLASMKGMDYAGQVGVGHFYHIFYEGALTNFEIGKEGEEASKLYPEVKYTRMNEYLKIYA